MMTLEFMKFEDLMSINNIFTHFYIDSKTKMITCLRDDLQLKESIDKDLDILKQFDCSSLEVNPFENSSESEPTITQMMIVNDVAYEIRAAINDDTSNTHYILMPFDLRIMGNKNKFVREKEILSKRETEILILFSKGLSMTKIAKVLSISPHTVDTHRLKLCKKLNVRRTTQLAVWAYKLGLSYEHEQYTLAS